jgi:hypothetical protein
MSSAARGCKLHRHFSDRGTTMTFTIFQWQAQVRAAGIYGGALWLANLIAKQWIARYRDIDEPIDFREFPIDQLERNGTTAWERLRDAGYFTGTIERAHFALPTSMRGGSSPDRSRDEGCRNQFST